MHTTPQGSRRSVASSAVDVACFWEDRWEEACLSPLVHALRERGVSAVGTGDFRQRSRIGVYACHTNRFFDFRRGRWRPPGHQAAIIAPHDLWQDGGAGVSYFESDSWHFFDLALIPGDRWARLVAQASAAGVVMPRLGARVVGWPKSDADFKDRRQFSRGREGRQLRADLGLRPDERVVLLAASWQQRRHLREFVSVLGSRDDIRLAIKFPHWSQPTPTEHPWKDLMCVYRLESALAAHEARAHDGLIVMPSNVDDAVLLGACDVVVSNCSNLMLEGLIRGIPGIAISDWSTPAGPVGQHEAIPDLALDGIIRARARSLDAAINVALTESARTLALDGGQDLVDPATRGQAAEIAAGAVIEVMNKT